MKVGLTPFSRSMSTPSNPYCWMIEKTLLAKLLALVASLTRDRAVLPADREDDLLAARLQRSAMSLMNCAWV